MVFWDLEQLKNCFGISDISKVNKISTKMVGEGYTVLSYHDLSQPTAERCVLSLPVLLYAQPYFSKSTILKLQLWTPACHVMSATQIFRPLYIKTQLSSWDVALPDTPTSWIQISTQLRELGDQLMPLIQYDWRHSGHCKKNISYCTKHGILYMKIQVWKPLQPICLRFQRFIQCCWCEWTEKDMCSVGVCKDPKNDNATVNASLLQICIVRKVHFLMEICENAWYLITGNVTISGVITCKMFCV